MLLAACPVSEALPSTVVTHPHRVEPFEAMRGTAHRLARFCPAPHSSLPARAGIAAAYLHFSCADHRPMFRSPPPTTRLAPHIQVPALTGGTPLFTYPP